MRLWYKGWVTDCRKDNNFVKSHRKLEDDTWDHKWYHTKHTKFKNVKLLDIQANESRLGVVLPQLHTNVQETTFPQISKETPKPKMSCPKNSKLK